MKKQNQIRDQLKKTLFSNVEKKMSKSEQEYKEILDIID
jgi:hypothetical protein